MQIKIQCSSCKGYFSVDDRHVDSDAEVSSKFNCPYCGYSYNAGDSISITGTTGGVTINGTATIKGSVVGRDSYTYKK